MTKLYFGDDNQYEWEGGLGAWFKSRERKHVAKGDVRLIEGQLFHVYCARPAYLFSPREVWWTPIGTNDVEAMREFKRRITLT